MINLKNFTTFRIPAFAPELIIFSQESDLIHYSNTTNHTQHNRIILGGGSNTVFTKDTQNTIILNQLLGKTIIAETEDMIHIKIASGENRNDFVERCIHHNYGGVENLIFIPGTVGGAPVQNIGAYGTEIKDTLINVEGVFLSSGTRKVFTAQQCQFGYRDSIFKHELKNEFFITSITLSLHKLTNNYQYNISYHGIQEELQGQGWKQGDPLTLRQVAEAIKRLRQQKLPDWTTIGTAGSFFKNPIIGKQQLSSLQQKFPGIPSYSIDSTTVKLSAGRLISHSGLDTTACIGDIGLYHKHALVLINYGRAQGNDLLQFIDLIIKKVYKNFTITLVPEVNIY